MRMEKDLLGELPVPDDKYYGVQTLRSLHLNPVSYVRMHHYPDSITALAEIKIACAEANRAIGAMEADVADAVVAAAREIVDGKYADQFQVDMFSGGGGIAVHMNINEIIANRANEILTGSKGYDRVHPNTHVNMCQSTNDVVPSAMRLVIYRGIEKLCASVKVLEDALTAKAGEFAHDVKLGRTCLQDALPMTFGQEFSGYAAVVRRQRQRLLACMPEWLTLTLGGTAIGTCLGVMPGFVPEVYRRLRANVHPDIRPDENFFDGMQNADGYLHLSGIVKCLAVSCGKIAYDLKLLSSGPFAGFGELVLPAVQPGSSIMPGKVNPALPEMIIQIAQQVCGNDTVLTMAVEKGELDLNIAEQILLKCSADSLSLLEKALPIFAEKCVAGIAVNRAKALHDAESSPALVMIISMLFGYKEGLAVAGLAAEKGIGVKAAAVASGLVTSEQADELFNVLTLTDSEATARLLEKYASIRRI